MQSGLNILSVPMTWKRRIRDSLWVMLAAALFTACARSDSAPQISSSGPMHLTLNCSAFNAGATIPARFTCQGENISPPLQWTNAPPATKSFALLCEDPDAPSGLWVHWVLFNLPADTTHLDEHLPPREELPNGARQGRNDFKHIGYGGPCPPPGPPHRYFFKLYALDAPLDLSAGASRQQLLESMQGHILAQTELMAKYQRH